MLDISLADTVAIFPFSGDRAPRAGLLQSSRPASRPAAGAGRPRRPGRSARRVRRRSAPRRARARACPVERLFTFAYLTGAHRRSTSWRSDDRIGATSEPWPLVAQLVRRASFDLLAAYIERAQLEPSDAAITDKLTTLHTRPLFDAVLAKEVERAGPLRLSAFVDSVRRRSSVRRSTRSTGTASATGFSSGSAF